MKCFYPIYRTWLEVSEEWWRVEPKTFVELPLEADSVVGLIFDVVGFGLLDLHHLSIPAPGRVYWAKGPYRLGLNLLTAQEEASILAKWRYDCERLGASRVIGKAAFRPGKTPEEWYRSLVDLPVTVARKMARRKD